MIGTETLRELVSVGMSAEQILAISEAMDRDAARSLPAVDEQAQRRRAADRERKKNARMRNVCGKSAETVAEISPSLSPSPSFPPDPQTNPTPTPAPVKNHARKGARLEEGWEPHPLTAKTAEIVRVWPVGAIEREIAKFKNYWIAKAGRDACKVDWQRTWENWLISADERISKNGPTGRKIGANGPQELDGFHAAIRRMSGFGSTPTGTQNRRGGADTQGMGGAPAALFGEGNV